MTEHTLETIIIVTPVKVCSTCGCTETELPTECPGYPLSPGVKTRLYAKRIDFINDKWTTL